MRISVYDLSYTALPHTFRMASLYGHHTNAHVTGCQQWHYQKLPLLITAFIAGCPIEGFGNDRVMPFCPPKSIILHRKFCFTDDFLLYKRQFLSTQAYCMWQTSLLRPICLSVLRQGQGTFVMLTRVPDLSVAQLSLLT